MATVLTNVGYSPIVMLVFTCYVCLVAQLQFIFLHILKGAPWIPQDQGDCRVLTHWEQIDYGEQFTDTRKFLSVAPVIT